MAVYHGKAGVVYMSTSGTGAATNVIKLTQWTLNQTTDKVEVTAFGDTNKTYVQGLKDVQGSLTGFYDDTEAKPFQAADSTDGVKLYLYPSANSPTKYWYGPAWVDFSVDTGVAAAVTINGAFAANGAWARL
jgi:hypothetical protein